MSHYSKYHFITQYISLRGTAVNEFYRMIRMEVAGYVKPGLHVVVVVMVVSTVANMFLTLFQAVLIHVNTFIITSQA